MLNVFSEKIMAYDMRSKFYCGDFFANNKISEDYTLLLVTFISAETVINIDHYLDSMNYFTYIHSNNTLDSFQKVI